MKQTYLSILLTMLMSMTGAKALAHDIEATNADGVTIYYNFINDGTELEVTYRGSSYSAYDEYAGNVVIPESVATYSVTSIGRYAFASCRGLTELTIPNSVTSIGEYAVFNCSRLTELTIPNSVTSIGERAFQYCSGLTELTIPNSVTSIGNYAFYDCSGLTELTIGNNVTSIEAFAFAGCDGLEKIVVDIDNPYYDSREDCNAVIRKEGNVLVVGCKNTLIPNSVTSIGDAAFDGCIGLTELTIPNSVTSIGRYAFYDCSGLTELTIGNSVTSIGDVAFYRCSGLTELTIPNSVTSIGNDAFSSCSGLTKLTIPNSVTSIGDGAFFGCSGLTELTIPNSVTSIGSLAFWDCSGLTSITSLNTTPPTINGASSYSAFDSTTEQNVPLHVPAGCKEAYQQAEYWKNFLNIQDDAVDGIESIRVGKQDRTTIYTLDGKRLQTTNTAGLPKGIYIINGKKVTVK